MAEKGLDVDRKRRKLTAAHAGVGAATGATGAVLGTKLGNTARRFKDSLDNIPATRSPADAKKWAAAGRISRAPQSAKKPAAVAALGGAAAFGAGSNALHRRVHGTNKKPTGRTDEPKNFRELVKKDQSTSAFGVDHGISKKLGPALKAVTPGRHAASSANITGNYGEVPMLNRSLRGKPGKRRKDMAPVTKAFTGFLAAPASTRAGKLAGMAAKEKKVTGNKPLGFARPKKEQASMFRGPSNTGKPRR